MLQRRYENLTDAFHGRADVQLVLLVQKASHQLVHRIFNLSVPEELVSFLVHTIAMVQRVFCCDSRASSPVLNPLESLARLNSIS